jgi:hypothetical protein
MDTRGRRNSSPDPIDFSFIVGTAIAAVVAIAVSLALDVPIVSEVAVLASP